MITSEFLTAGNAIFTVCNAEGRHYTFKFRQPKGKDIVFAQLLTGPNNTSDYTYLGVFNGKQVVPTRASRFRNDSVPMRVVNFAIRVISGRQSLPEGYKIHHEGRCGRCSRLLTTPESVEFGIGPECRTKMGLGVN